MQIQQNIFFLLTFFYGKLLKHFTSILAFGQFCLIWHEVIKIQQRSPLWNSLFKSFTTVSHQEGCPEIPGLKYDRMLPFTLNFENNALHLAFELSPRK